MRVATLNVWGIRGDWPARLPLLRDGFAAMAAWLRLRREGLQDREAGLRRRDHPARGTRQEKHVKFFMQLLP
jgi:hypothetical protein